MKIPSMGELEIGLYEDGSIMLTQKDHSGGDDAIVSFPREMAKTITDEIMRLAASLGPTAEDPH